MFSVLIDAAGHRHFRLLEIHSEPFYWLDLDVWDCGALASIRVPDLAISTLTHLSIPIFYCCIISLFTTVTLAKTL